MQHQLFEQSRVTAGIKLPGKDDDCEGDDDDEEYDDEDDELEESEESEEGEDDDDDDDDEDKISGLSEEDLQLAVDRTMLQDQAMLAASKIAAQDMVNAAAAALKDTKAPVKPANEVKPDSEKSSPKALGDSSAEKVVANGKMEEVKLDEVAVEILPEEKVEKVSPAKPEAPKQEESNKENLSSGEKTEKPEAAAE